MDDDDDDDDDDDEDATDEDEKREEANEAAGASGEEKVDPAREAALKSGAGFYRSRFLQQGEKPGEKVKLYLLAVPRANKKGVFYLTRPNSGPSPFDEEEFDLKRKYEKVSAEVAEKGWNAAYKAAEHEDVGGRISHVQMLTGSTLPLLPLLEGLVKKNAPHLLKREQSISAIRVNLNNNDGSSTRLVGVRFPQKLMDDLKMDLLQFIKQRGGVGALKLHIDEVVPVDEKELARRSSRSRL